MSSEEEEVKTCVTHPPVQETKFPEDCPLHHEVSDIDQQKETFFRQTSGDPQSVNLDAHLPPNLPMNDGASNPSEKEEERPPSSGSEPVENEDDSAQDFSKVSLRDPPLPDEFSKQSSAAAVSLECEKSKYETQGTCLRHEHATCTHEHDEEVMIRQRMIREQRERGSSSCNSSASTAELRAAFAQSRLSQDSFGVCDECDLLRKSYNSEPSIVLWEEVERGCTGNDFSQRCHRKFWSKFLEKIKEKCKNGDTKDKNLRELLKRLLQVEGKEPAEEILFSNVVSCMRYFGPLIDSDGQSPFLAHMKEIVSKSLTTVADGKSKISWFAGRMSRDEAEEKLKNEKDFTYLIRMSTTEAESGSFVVSVKREDVHHFEIEGNAEEAVKSHPFSCSLHFAGHTFKYVTDVVKYLKANPIIDVTEDGSEERIWCRHICPGLPLNSAIVKYKRSGHSTKSGT